MERFDRETALCKDGLLHEGYKPVDAGVKVEGMPDQKVDIYWCRKCNRPEDDIRGAWELDQAARKRRN